MQHMIGNRIVQFPFLGSRVGTWSDLKQSCWKLAPAMNDGKSADRQTVLSLLSVTSCHGNSRVEYEEAASD